MPSEAYSCGMTDRPTLAPAPSAAVTLDEVPDTPANRRALRWIRICIWIEVLGLVASGVTAFPLREELRLGVWAVTHTPLGSVPGLAEWIQRVSSGLDRMQAAEPWIAYGTDWLAFAHLVIAVAFLGALRDPIRNVWVIRWGMIACVGIVPLALIAGTIRGLPWGWIAIDCSFGVLGIIPLLVALRLTARLADDTP